MYNKKISDTWSALCNFKEFHRIVFSQKSDELDEWMIKASNLDIDEINTYISGLKNDLDAVKNGIQYKYNNGLAEEVVLTKSSI